MSKIIKFLPKQNCYACGAPLRPATKIEIKIDLQSEDYREIAELAAQGDIEAQPDKSLPEWKKDIFEPASWLLRCDKCGARVLWSKDES